MPTSTGCGCASDGYGRHLCTDPGDATTETATWIVKMEGGPAFPANAVAACRIAARDRPALAAVFTRLAAAIDSAQPEEPAS